MSKRMNFGVGLNFYTDKFKRGAKEVNTVLAKIKGNVLAMGAAFAGGGFAISSFFSKATETVRSLSKAQATLKNVTKDTYGYNDALSFLNETAKKYNAEIIGLTEGYAKLLAASEGTGMKLQQIKGLFDSVTQASSYFNLSADQTSATFLALTQMLSKGNIQAEELRGQLGERMPGALNIMARALGVTTKQLDKLMKDGKLLASEVLPKFAEQLKLETAGFNPDTIEGSINRLKNTFTEMFNSPELQKGFKSFINGLTKALEFAANNISSIFIGATSTMIMVITSMFQKYLASMNKEARVIYNKFETLEGSFNSKANSIPVPQSNGVVQYPEADVNKIRQLRDAMKNLWSDSDITKFNMRLNRTQELFANLNLTSVQARMFIEKTFKDFNTLYERHHELYDSTGGNLDRIIEQQHRLESTTQSTSRLGRAWTHVSTSVLRAGNAISSFIQANLVGIALGAITGLVLGCRELYNEAKRIKNLSKDSILDVNNTSASSTTITAAEKLMSNYKAATGKLSEQKKILSDINKILGITEDNSLTREALEKKINQTIADRKQLILNEARAQAAANKLVELERQKSDLAKQKEKLFTNSNVFQGLLYGFKAAFLGISFESETAAIDEAIKALKKEFGDLIADMELKKAGNYGTTVTASEGYDKIISKYNESFTKLKNQYQNNIIGFKEFNKQLVDLRTNTASEIGALSNLSASQKKYMNDLKNYSSVMTLQGRELKAPEAKALNISGINSELKALKNLNTPTANRDSLFDYRYSKDELQKVKLEFDLEQAKEKLALLKDAFSSNAETFAKDLSAAIANVDDLEKALKMQEVLTDVKQLKKELFSSTVEGISNLANTTNQTVESVRSLRAIFEDDEATGWERFIASLNAFINIINTLNNTISTISNIASIISKLAGAVNGFSLFGGLGSLFGGAKAATGAAGAIASGGMMAMSKTPLLAGASGATKSIDLNIDLKVKGKDLEGVLRNTNSKSMKIK